MKKLFRNIIILSIILVVLLKIITLFPKKTEKVKPISKENVCVSLNYHRVRPKTLWYKTLKLITKSKELTTYTVSKDTFENQIDTLIKEGAYFATLEEVEEFRKSGNFPPKCVWISFDDVDKSVYEYAYPILKERQIPFTLFVISSKVGSDNFNNLQMATWDDLREMRDSGLASFGSHTHNMHYLEDNKASFLHKDNYVKFENDIKTSKEVIKKELGIDVTSIAYPFGNTNDTVTEIVKSSGYTNAFILAPNPITPNSDPFYMDRYLIYDENYNNLIIPWLKKYN